MNRARKHLDDKPTRESIRRLLARVAEMDFNTFDESADIRADLEIDSLRAVQVLAALETELNIVIDEAKVFDVVTVKDLVDLVLECLPKQGTQQR